MKVLIDACVLYPTVMREVVLAVAATGAFQPLWSARILEEWARAARRNGGEADEVLARGDIAALGAHWPRAEVPPAPGLENRLYLPDENDIHVLASAIEGSAALILTLNAKDFPRHTLREEGLDRADPDGFLVGLFHDTPEPVAEAVMGVVAKAEALSGQPQTPRKLMKKARLPRLGKAVEAYQA